MKIQKLILVVVFSFIFLAFVFIPNVNVKADKDVYFTTITGVINIFGTGELNSALLKSNKGNFSLNGKYANELKQLSKAEVRITGMVKSNAVPPADKNLQV